MDERETIRAALQIHKGNVEQAAEHLGISYRTLLRRMREAGVPVRKRGRPRRVLREIGPR